MDARVGLWRKLSAEELMFLTAELEKTLEGPLDCKEIQPVHSKGDQSWVFFGKTDAKVKAPILWPPHAKSWLIGKDSDAGRDWGQEEKGTTEDEMAGWYHRLNGREFEWTLGVGDGQGGLACCDSWGCKESDTTERLNWTELKQSARIHGSLFRKCRAGVQQSGGKVRQSIRGLGDEFPSCCLEGPEDPLEKEMANPLQYSCLGNPMDRGAWWAIVHGVAKSRTRLSDWNKDSWGPNIRLTHSVP